MPMLDMFFKQDAAAVEAAAAKPMIEARAYSEKKQADVNEKVQIEELKLKRFDSICDRAGIKFDKVDDKSTKEELKARFRLVQELYDGYDDK